MATFAGELVSPNFNNFAESGRASYLGSFASSSNSSVGASQYFINQGWYAATGTREMWITAVTPNANNVNPFTGHALTGVMYEPFFL